MSPQQRRRFLILWAPLVIAGVALILTSFVLVAPFDGRTLLGWILGLLGLWGACWDEKTTTAGRLP